MSDLLAEAVRALREATRPSLEGSPEARHAIFEETRERILVNVQSTNRVRTSTGGPRAYRRKIAKTRTPTTMR